MNHLFIDVIFDTMCAVPGILALFRAGRCAHGRFAVRAAGGALVLYALISLSWYLWLRFFTHPAQASYYGAEKRDVIFQLSGLLELVQAILGPLLLTVAVALLITVPVIRSRREFAHPGTARFETGQYPHGPAHSAPGPQPQQPRPQAWPPGQGTAAQQPHPNPGRPGQWSPPPQPGQPPPQGPPPPEH